MGQYITIVVERRNDRGEWFCAGVYPLLYRNCEKTLDIHDSLEYDVPPNSTLEAKSEFSQKFRDDSGFIGKKGEQVDLYHTVGSMPYDKWLKIMGELWFDPYKKKLHDDMRVVVGFQY